MRHLRPLHKIHGGLRIIQVCRDWPKWFREYFSPRNDGSADIYRMRCVSTSIHAITDQIST